MTTEAKTLLPVIVQELDYSDFVSLIELDKLCMFDVPTAPPDHAPPQLTIDELEAAKRNGDIFKGIFSPGETQLVGYCWFSPRQSDLYFASGAVHPNFRGQNIPLLFKEITDKIAIEKGLARVTGSVDPLNGQSISGGFKQGFVITGFAKAYFGEQYPSTERLLLERTVEEELNIRKYQAGEQQLILCGDSEGLLQAIQEGFVGISLIRSRDRDNRNNQILFRRPIKV